MRWFLLALVLLVCLLVAMVLAGAMLPVKHQVQGVATVHQNPEFVWNLVADAEKQPKWRPKVVRVERLPDRDGHPVWREYYKNGQKLAFETIASDPPRRLVRKIVDESAFGGEWEICLTAHRRGYRSTGDRTWRGLQPGLPLRLAFPDRPRKDHPGISGRHESRVRREPLADLLQHA